MRGGILLPPYGKALQAAVRMPGVPARSGKRRWSPGLMALPPHISIDADRLDLLTKDGSNNLLTVTTEFTGLTTSAVAQVVHEPAVPLFGGRAGFRTFGNANTNCNFAALAGSLMAGKTGCTLVFVGKFEIAGAAALNRCIVNVSTPTITNTRCSIATSASVANCPRYTVRRLDTDTSNGDDVGTINRGVNPWIAVVRQDNTGAVLGSGVPTKQMIFLKDGVREVAQEATGLGSGAFSNTASAYIGFFNSGTVAPSRCEMNWGAIFDRVCSDAEVEQLLGWGAWKINAAATLLEAANPYRAAPPMV